MPLITDRDLLVIEPTVFTAAAAAATNVITATDAAVADTTLSSATSDFATPAIDAGHVITFDGDALEVVSRLSSTSLEVSRPRASSDDEKIVPISGSNKTAKINTFDRLIDRTEHDLLRALGMDADDPVLPLSADDVINPAPLANVLALRVLERAFDAAAALDPEDATLAARGTLYRSQADIAAASVAVLIDSDGDGEADETRHLNLSVLRRV